MAPHDLASALSIISLSGFVSHGRIVIMMDGSPSGQILPSIPDAPTELRSMPLELLHHDIGLLIAWSDSERPQSQLAEAPQGEVDLSWIDKAFEAPSPILEDKTIDAVIDFVSATIAQRDFEGLDDVILAFTNDFQNAHLDMAICLLRLSYSVRDRLLNWKKLRDLCAIRGDENPNTMDALQGLLPK